MTRSLSRSQSRRPESQGRENGDIKTTLDYVLKRLNVLDEKHNNSLRLSLRKSSIHSTLMQNM